MATPTAPTVSPGRLRSALAKLASDFRRSDRFSKMRLGVVAGWAAVTCVTLAAVCPSAGSGNSLGAEVQFLRESFVGGAQVLVRNDSDDVWRDVVLTIDGEWRHRHPTLRPRDQVVVPTTQFRRGGDVLPPDHRPRRLEVECDQGSHSFDVR